nr:hypothetical protein [Tanacetum cinerariifolium]
MAAPGPSNIVARRVINDLIDISGEADMPKFMKDDIHEENTKLEELNGVIVQAKERITMKEERVKVMKDNVLEMGYLGYGWQRMLCRASCIPLDKMKIVFSQACSEDEYFIGLIHELCYGLRLSLNKNRRLIPELEALGQRGDALRSLEYMREMACYAAGMDKAD